MGCVRHMTSCARRRGDRNTKANMAYGGHIGVFTPALFRLAYTIRLTQTSLIVSDIENQSKPCAVSKTMA